MATLLCDRSGDCSRGQNHPLCILALSCSLTRRFGRVVDALSPASRRAKGGVLKRALAPLTWWAIGIGYALAVGVFVLPGTWFGTAAYLFAALVLVAATFVA